MAHSVMTVPFATVLMLVSLSQLDRRIDLAARALGATVWERATRIIMPNIKFGIVTAALLSFVLSWEEIGVTLFITSVNAITLPRLMWMGLRDNIDPAIAALSVILIIIRCWCLRCAASWSAARGAIAAPCPDRALMPLSAGRALRSGQRANLTPSPASRPTGRGWRTAADLQE
jgi:putative spermidine/putrescine transport system permease protein